MTLNNLLDEIEKQLLKLEAAPSMVNAKICVGLITQLLVKSPDFNPETCFKSWDGPGARLREKASWFQQDEIRKDRVAAYEVEIPANCNLDVKLFCLEKSHRSVIAWVQALTDNFEDEVFNVNFNVGIDFIVPNTNDRVYIALGNRRTTRIMELKGSLSRTYQDILLNWEKIVNFSNKTEFHNALWTSFDLNPINRDFYRGIQERFYSLLHHLEEEKHLEAKNAQLFANRLLGRIIFAWFLNRKGLLSKPFNYLDSSKFKDDNDYYNKVLAVLFFDVLNKPIEKRKNGDKETPYLNGGLFELRESESNLQLTFPKNYFDDLFEFLGSYNFTTDESSSQFQQVAIDPEMLGKIFESLLAEVVEETGKQARKAKGAFYTPREIVDYMCRESLKRVLMRKLPWRDDLEQRLKQLIDEPDNRFQDQASNWRRDWKGIKEPLVAILDDLKIIDPACGSGAFPMGMLQLLLRVYERLETRFDPYKTKIKILENNIYGIDLEPMAVEISKLRAWLSLIVDEDKTGKSFLPLPNLEFHFACVNSLIDVEDAGMYALDESFDNELEIQFENLRNSYFHAQDIEQKIVLRERYTKLTKKSNSIFGESKRSLKLKTYNPFDFDAAADFFDSKIMFGVSSFDIVIANPPYISAVLASQSIPEEIRAEYKSIYKSAVGSYDLYILFFERGIKLLNRTGVLVNISPRKFLSAPYGQAFREIVGRDKFVGLYDFSDDNVFDSANVSTLISVFDATKVEDDVKVRIFTNAFDLIGGEEHTYPRSTLSEFPESLWGFLLTDQFELLRKAHRSKLIFSSRMEVRNSSTVTESIALRKAITDGGTGHKVINTGNSAQWVTRWGRTEYRNGDVKLFRPYVNLKEVSGRRLEMFTKEKVIVSKLQKRIVAAVDLEGQYASHDTVFLYDFEEPWDSMLVGSLLNSEILNRIYSIQFAGLNMPGEWYQYQAPQLKLLPLPRIENRLDKNLLKLRDLGTKIFRRLQDNPDDVCQDLREQLDKVVSALYKIDL